MEKTHRNSLQSGYRLHWYEIKEILGQGGFGITYLAYDTNLDEDVAIKEFLPIELATREGDFSIHPLSESHKKNYEWGLDRFINEARTLTRFKHPSIVRVRNVFEDNNTAYMVMEYEHGESLQQLLTRRKTLEEAELIQIIIPLLGGLEIVHESRFIHRDIKPANIFIRDDGSPLLLDFGSARQALGMETKTLTSLVSPGYAPFEQYYSKSDEQGPFTDIYGLGATLYRAVTGVGPMDAVDRSKSIIQTSNDTIVNASEIAKGKYSERFLIAIDHAMKFKPEDRPQTVAEWKKEFDLPDNPIKEAIAIEQQITQPGKTVLARQQKAKPRSIMVIALVTILISAVAVFYFQEDIRQLTRSTDENRLATLEQKAVLRLVEEKSIAEEQKQLEEKARLQEQRHIADLFKKAEEDINQNRLVEPLGENAFETYLQILEIDSGNEEAIAGQKRVFKALLVNIESFINKNQFDNAENALIRADAIEPDSVEIRLVKVRLKDAIKAAEQKSLEEKQRREEEEKQRLAEFEKQQLEEVQKGLAEEKERKEGDRLTQLEKTKKEEERKRLELEQKRERELAQLKLLEVERKRKEEEQERLLAIKEQEMRARMESEKKLKLQEELIKQESGIRIIISQIDSKYQNMGLRTSELTDEVQRILVSAGYNMIELNQSANPNNDKTMELAFNPKNAPNGKFIGWHIMISVKQAGETVWSAEDKKKANTLEVYGGTAYTMSIENLADAKDSFINMAHEFASKHRVK